MSFAFDFILQGIIYISKVSKEEQRDWGGGWMERRREKRFETRKSTVCIVNKGENIFSLALSFEVYTYSFHLFYFFPLS